MGSSICLASSVGCAEGAGGSPFPRSENLLSKRIRGILRNLVSFPYFRKKESIMRSRGVWDSTPLRDDLLLLNGTSGEKEVGDDGNKEELLSSSSAHSSMWDVSSCSRARQCQQLPRTVTLHETAAE